MSVHPHDSSQGGVKKEHHRNKQKCSHNNDGTPESDEGGKKNREELTEIATVHGQFVERRLGFVYKEKVEKAIKRKKEKKHAEKIPSGESAALWIHHRSANHEQKDGEKEAIPAQELGKGIINPNAQTSRDVKEGEKEEGADRKKKNDGNATFGFRVQFHARFFFVFAGMSFFASGHRNKLSS